MLVVTGTPNKPAANDLTYVSVMYIAKKSWLCENLDWKQLGLMIYWLIHDDCYEPWQQHVLHQLHVASETLALHVASLITK